MLADRPRWHLDRSVHLGVRARRLADGTYTFSVRATNSVGQVDTTPATREFIVDTQPRLLNQWGAYGIGPGEINSPRSVAVEQAGTVLVADSQNGRIAALHRLGEVPWPNGRPRACRRRVDAGRARGRRRRRCVRRDVERHRRVRARRRLPAPDRPVRRLRHRSRRRPSGDLYLLGCGTVEHRSSTGVLLDRWGTTGSGNGQFMSPRGIATDGAGFVYVADSEKLPRAALQRQWHVVGKWGTQGSGDGQGRPSTDVTVGRERCVRRRRLESTRPAVHDDRRLPARVQERRTAAQHTSIAASSVTGDIYVGRLGDMQRWGLPGATDTEAPDTFRRGTPPAVTAAASVTVDFAATETDATFERQAAGDWTPCTAPHTIGDLADGQHTVSVRARDAAGNVDGWPLEFQWTVDSSLRTNGHVLSGRFRRRPDHAAGRGRARRRGLGLRG